MIKWEKQKRKEEGNGDEGALGGEWAGPAAGKHPIRRNDGSRDGS